MVSTNTQYMSTLPGVCKIVSIVFVMLAISLGGHAYEKSFYNMVYNLIQLFESNDFVLPIQLDLPGLGRERFFVAVLGMIFIISVLLLLAHIMNSEVPYDRAIKLTDIVFHIIAAIFLITAGSLIIASARKINNDICKYDFASSSEPPFISTTTTATTTTTTTVPTTSHTDITGIFSSTTESSMTTESAPSTNSELPLTSTMATTDTPTVSVSTILTTSEASTTPSETSEISTSTPTQTSEPTTTDIPSPIPTTSEPTTIEIPSTIPTTSEPTTTDTPSTIPTTSEPTRTVMPSPTSGTKENRSDSVTIANTIPAESFLNKLPELRLGLDDNQRFNLFDEDDLDLDSLVSALSNIKCQYKAEKEVGGSFAIIGSFLYIFIAVIQFLRLNTPPEPSSTMMQELR